jgi:transcriptional regulator with XRE-family HTH domain
MKVNKKNLYKQIGQRIKEWRSDNDLTQEQLAISIGVLRTSIANIEAGRQKAPLHVLYEICSVFDKEITELLPSQKELAFNDEIRIEIGGLVKSIPPESSELIKKLLQE